MNSQRSTRYPPTGSTQTRSITLRKYGKGASRVEPWTTTGLHVSLPRSPLPRQLPKYVRGRARPATPPVSRAGPHSVQAQPAKLDMAITIGLLLIGALLAWIAGNRTDWQRQSDRYYALFGVLTVAAMALIALATLNH